MVIANFNKTLSANTAFGSLWQWDYGQTLRIQGLDLPTAVEIHFSLQEAGGGSLTRVGVTRDGVTDVVIPDSMLENNGSAYNYNIYAFIYLTDDTSGETAYKIIMPVKSRPKPEAFDTPEDTELFREAIAAVNEAAERAGNAASMAEEAKTAATGSETNAAASASEAKTSETNAKTSEEAAKEAMQTARDAAAGVAADREQITALKKTRSSSIVQTATGAVIVAQDSSDDPVRGLRVFGRTEQVTTTGKNLFNPENVLEGYFRENISITMTSNTRTVYASCLPDTTYTISKTAGARFFVGYTSEIPTAGTLASGVINNSTASAITITTGSDAVYLVAFIYIGTADTITAEEMLASVQIELGDTATDWEPYTGGIPSPNPDYPQELVSVGDGGSVEVSITRTEDNVQSLTLQTPNGLPGIPVTDESLATYTDADGQMWCADEVDLERGVYVQRVLLDKLDSSHNWKYSPATNRFYCANESFVSAKTDRDYYPNAFCSHFSMCGHIGAIASNNLEFSLINSEERGFAFRHDDLNGDLDAWKTFLNENDVYVLGVLASLIETPLTESELATYQSLHSNYPVTTVLNDAGTHMEFSYNADPKNYIAAEHAKMEAAFDAKLAEIIALLPAETQAAMIDNETTNLLNESEE